MFEVGTRSWHYYVGPNQTKRVTVTYIVSPREYWVSREEFHPDLRCYVPMEGLIHQYADAVDAHAAAREMWELLVLQGVEIPSDKAAE